MAVMESQEASSTRYSYHVFLSFRGKDTRKTFTDHLYTALLHAGIRTFRDDDELGRGYDISSELIKAIEESRISIIVFSKDYASSTWCLDELLKILECKKSVGHMILPVFYHVNPSDLRWLKGSFKEAFAKHEERFKLNSNERKEERMDKIRRWKEALKEVANLSGLELKEKYESYFIHEIIKEVGNKLNRTVLSVCLYPVGLDSRINEINLWLQDGSNEVGIMEICGMRGIGKTTIAKTVYNLNFDRFEGSSFLANVREISKEPSGLVCLQRQLLSDILKGKKIKISNVDEGIIKIREAIWCKRILLVLDDVDDQDQLNAVLTMRSWFQQGSKIIITTTNEQLLKAHELHMKHGVKNLTDDESFQLFSWHAFGQDHPIEGYMEHTERVVKYCGGLPLALQILGSSLYGRRVDVWESAIKKLEAIPDSQIIRKLKISFDSLEEDHDKNLFLDIATFFVGKDKDFVITILDGCKYFTKFGIDNLTRRYLLTINEDNKLTMHQLLRDMGRDIIRQESLKEPGKRSRLWHHEDALNVLREKTGTETIEGLILNLPGSNSLEQRGTGLGFFSWLPGTSTSTESSSTSNEEDLQTDAFSKMRNLRLLQLNNVRLTGNYKQFPRKLRWLCWSGFSLEFIPIEFCLENLVVLEMKNSNLKQVWKGKKLLRSLKVLNLSHSHGVTNMFDFSNVPNLESLILKDCKNLIEVHESIGELKRLVQLNLQDCKNLRNLPTNIGQLKSLEIFILSGCSKLDKLPKELCEMESLKVFHADGAAINQLASTSSDMKSWYSQWLTWVSRPRKSPELISFSLDCLPHSLVRLSLANCNLSDDAISRVLGRLSLLQVLNLDRNPIRSLPESIKGLTMLRRLRLNRCTRLQLLPELPMSLQVLDVSRCRSLEILTNLPNLLTSLSLSRYGCKKLVEVKKLFRLEPIGNIDAEAIKNLELVELDSMENVEVKLFNNMTSGYMIGPIQALYEFGIFSIFHPWNEVPHWFSNKSTNPLIDVIHLNVPSLPNLKIRGLNVCVVYALGWNHQCYMSIFNKTKDVKWIYYPTFLGVPDEGNMRWSSHWKIENQLEAGDQVLVEVGVRDKSKVKVKEFGVHIVYEEEEKDTHHNTNASCPGDVIHAVDLSSYEIGTISESQLSIRTYCLNHYEFSIFQHARFFGGRDLVNLIKLRLIQLNRLNRIQ